MISPGHSSQPFSPSALRITELLLLALAAFGLVCFVAAVYFVWVGVSWYKLGGLVACAALTIAGAFIGLRSIRERRRTARRVSESTTSTREAKAAEPR